MEELFVRSVYVIFPTSQNTSRTNSTTRHFKIAMSFRLISAKFDNSFVELSKKSDSDNIFTIIIGKNGVGKSRLLSNIARLFRLFDHEVNPRPLSGPGFEISYEIDGRIYYVANSKSRVAYAPSGEISLPNRVICTSVSPFDKFPLAVRRDIKGPIDQQEKLIYRYLGSRNVRGQVTGKTRLNRFIESLVFASNRSLGERLQIADIFEFLCYKPEFSAIYRLNLNKDDRKRIFDSDFSLTDMAIAIRRRSYNRQPETVADSVDALSQLSSAMVENVLEAVRRLRGVESGRVQLDIDFFSSRISFERTKLDYEDIGLLYRLGLLTLENIYLTKTPENSPHVVLSINDLSSGEQSIVITLLGIAAEITNDSLVCIDEPEISLHPEWQEEFINLLTTTFSHFKGVHFILATHSPLILSRMQVKNSFVQILDEQKLFPASDYARHSADFQLAEAFKTPGFKNEYLAREAMTVLAMVAGKTEFDEDELGRRDAIIAHLDSLSPDDPVRNLIEAIKEAKTIRDDHRED